MGRADGEEGRSPKGATGLLGFEPNSVTTPPKPPIVCLVIRNLNDDNIPFAAIAHGEWSADAFTGTLQESAATSGCQTAHIYYVMTGKS